MPNKPSEIKGSKGIWVYVKDLYKKRNFSPVARGHLNYETYLRNAKKEFPCKLEDV